MKDTRFFAPGSRKALFRTLLCALTALLLAAGSAQAQDWAKLNRYKEQNDSLSAAGPKKTRRIVLMGDSITEYWKRHRPQYFSEHDYLCRGISGQTTPQMLVRFRQDVVNIGADTVVILAGTNDIAGNTGPVTLEMILDNIASMCEIARANRIHVILCSVLPARQYYWSKQARPDLLIPQLNDLLRAYALANDIPFVDYFSALTDGQNGLPERYSKDGVHPGEEGYRVMEAVLEPFLAAPVSRP